MILFEKEKIHFRFGKCIYLLMFLFVVVQVKSQINNIEIGRKYKNVKLFLHNYESIQAKTLTFNNDSTIYIENSLTGAKKIINIKEVKIISEKSGTYAGLYGVIGGLSCLAGALLGVAQAKNDPYYDEESFGDPTGLVIGLTAGGVAIGAIIGACIPKWKVLYVPEKKTSFNFQIAPDFDKDYCGVGVKMKF